MSNRVRPSMPPATAVPRLRPGGVPTWIALPEEVDEQRLLERARQLNVGVDALVASAIELALALDAVACRATEPLRTAIVADLELPRLAPTPALRRWVSSLSPTSPCAANELPELCVPVEVVEEAGPRIWELLARAEDDELAIYCERGSARRGVGLGDYVRRIVGVSDLGTPRKAAGERSTTPLGFP
jgi:hypothetical protein